VTPDRGDVGLADLARALRLLQPRDGAAVRALARHVGLEIADGPLAQFTGETTPQRPTEPTTTPSPSPAAPPAERPLPAAPVLIPLRSAGRDDLVPEEDPPEIPALALAAPAAGTVPWTSVRRAIEPLLRPLWTAGVLGRAAATYQPFGDIDIARVVDALSRLELPGQLPRTDVLTLMRGVQVLVDIGAGMEPFTSDEWQVVRQLRRIIGQDRTAVLQFRGSPLLGAGRGAIWTWDSYQPPEPGVPVVALTDLGLGGPPEDPGTPGREAWIELAELLQRRGSALLALVPYPPVRWPRGLESVMRIVEWSAGTGVQSVSTTRARHGS
jgi:hypothetical protein